MSQRVCRHCGVPISWQTQLWAARWMHYYTPPGENAESFYVTCRDGSGENIAEPAE